MKIAILPLMLSGVFLWDYGVRVRSIMHYWLFSSLLQPKSDETDVQTTMNWENIRETMSWWGYSFGSLYFLWDLWERHLRVGSTTWITNTHSWAETEKTKLIAEERTLELRQRGCLETEKKVICCGRMSGEKVYEEGKSESMVSSPQPLWHS